ncbi:hypothetical protein LEP1GSC175_0610 [Leptospira santarosai str. HAI821]|uniref:Uncharacterized protein n=1 Tax=Leptospira santarosai str. ZUN179 TaxID=1049985 RepID=M6UHI0_9LEPT|nr:hypothetical protein LEP1GSC039_2692 [Leptospira santarosai str. 2000027870]EMO32285.1 hypothetical protein LEP1GSC175_0610 [Leptospira santarosai str. HAI821]EMO44000.1 hypothetical protein LEP1GSC187_2649 [Leptospira santarosai str. ZUN179]
MIFVKRSRESSFSSFETRSKPFFPNRFDTITSTKCIFHYILVSERRFYPEIGFLPAVVLGFYQGALCNNSYDFYFERKKFLYFPETNLILRAEYENRNLGNRNRGT